MTPNLVASASCLLSTPLASRHVCACVFHDSQVAPLVLAFQQRRLYLSSSGAHLWGLGEWRRGAVASER